MKIKHILIFVLNLIAISELNAQASPLFIEEITLFTEGFTQPLVILLKQLGRYGLIPLLPQIIHSHRRLYLVIEVVQVRGGGYFLKMLMLNLLHMVYINYLLVIKIILYFLI
jgi:hypothetical protein